tara:strand:- start:61 stop:369 length:309 start_codon:yes stop_codon:yes gene_type:complete
MVKNIKRATKKKNKRRLNFMRKNFIKNRNKKINDLKTKWGKKIIRTGKKLKITGYNLFTAENINIFATLKMLGPKWKKLSPGTKTYYHIQADYIKNEINKNK